MTTKKKYIIAGAIGLVTILGAIAYLKLKGLADSMISYKRTKVKSISSKAVSLDVFMLYTNRSDITFTIKEQNYKIFINDQYISRMSNASPNVIKAKSESEIGMRAEFDPSYVAKTLGKSWSDMLLNPDKYTVKIDMKFKVGFGFLTITVPYSYSFTLKEMKSWYV